MFLKKGINWLDKYQISLQLRLAFFFTMATALILSIVSLLLYHELSEQLELKDKMELMHTSAVLSDAVSTMASKTSTESWRLTWKHTIDGRDRLSVRVYSPDGEVYVSTANMHIPSKIFPYPGSPDFTKWEKEDEKGGEKEEYYLLTAFTVESSPSRIWKVEAAYNTAPSYDMLENYLDSLMIILVTALIITISISGLITYYGLLPLRRIGSAMHEISPENLSSRIGNQSWPRELASLAGSFDAMLARLEAAFAQLHRFSADLAHEVRTPVNNMLTAASVTLARKRDTDEYQSTLETILTEGGHLERLVESMLFLARAENAKEKLHKDELSSAKEFQMQTDFFEALAAEKKIQFECSGESTFKANPELFRRALSNLIDNAIRHTHEGGIIRLASKESGSKVIFRISDTGIGIEKKHLEHIFERFYRVDTARTKRMNAGLGLSLVQSIATLHGGTISAASTLGEGTEFTISIPK